MTPTKKRLCRVTFNGKSRGRIRCHKELGHRGYHETKVGSTSYVWSITITGVVYDKFTRGHYEYS